MRYTYTGAHFDDWSAAIKYMNERGELGFRTLRVDVIETPRGLIYIVLMQKEDRPRGTWTALPVEEKDQK